MIQRKLFEKIKPFFTRENPGKWDVDRSLILIVAAITLLGFVALSSATLSYGNRPFLLKQGVATLLGTAIACGLMPKRRPLGGDAPLRSRGHDLGIQELARHRPH